MVAPSQQWSSMTDAQKQAYYVSRNRYRSAKSVGKFIAVDGESFTTDAGHFYTIMGASTGDYIYNPEGLSTFQCVDFLLKLKAKHKGYRFVGFAFNYDVNMMLVDLLEPELVRLWQTGSVMLRLDDGAAYRFEWMPSKSLQIMRMYDKLCIEISDTFGFFQSSFVKALEAWKIADPDGAIERMKGERANFGPDDYKEVLAYCLSECRLLVTMMQALEQALLQAGLRPAKWNGAGAVAASLLQREGVHKHKINDTDFGEDINEAIMHSYFGGRVEVFIQGLIQRVTNYDVRSAYPYEATKLPSLVGGEWKAHTDYVEAPYGLWLCRWEIDSDAPVQPFPYRKRGGITYPSAGYGWYHACEVAVALKHFGNAITIERGYTFTPMIQTKPFDFIPRVFAERAEAKRLGLASEKVLKLGLNSIYGKTAQGVGYRGKTPKFRSFFWAGMITAGTRSRLLDLALQAPQYCVSIATDGIVFTSDPGFTLSDELGGLERSEWSEFFIAQPGIYTAQSEDGKEFRKSRGFFMKEIDFPDLIEGWIKDGPYYQQTRKTRRFVGIGSALHRGRLDQWRTWPETDRTLKLHSSRKFYAYANSNRPIAKLMRLLPPWEPEPTLSDIYIPKGRVIAVGEFADSGYIAGLEQPRLDL